MTYVIRTNMWYGNSDVKSMCSITVTPEDIVRHHTKSYDVVRSVNTALVRWKSHWMGKWSTDSFGEAKIMSL